MQNTCPECDRLWEEYAQAARAHLAVVIQRHKAVIQNAAINDTGGVVDDFSPLEYDLAQNKLKARRAIGKHEAAHQLLHKPAQ